MAAALSYEMRRSSFSLLVAGRLLRPPPVAGLLRPLAEEIVDFISPGSFFNFVVLGGGGLSELAKYLLGDVVSMCGGGGQVVEVIVKIRGQVGTIKDTGEGAVGQGMDGDCIGVDVVEELGGGLCAE